MKNVYPAVAESVGNPIGKYQTRKYMTANNIAYGISQTTFAVAKANHPYTRLGNSLDSHNIRASKNYP